VLSPDDVGHSRLTVEAADETGVATGD
jgi:hypothetical protein